MAHRDWRHEAECRKTSLPDMFFPDARQAEYAKAYCRACPVAEQCLRYALDERLDEGVYGG
ncbi:WhiB family transcriptional regulator, partial [Streptomyces candidus]